VDLVLSGHTHRFTLGWLDPNGARIPVLVTPSASLLAPGPKQGGYLRITLAGTAGACSIEIERRVFDAGTRRMIDGGRLRLGDPSFDAAERARAFGA
jgi:hypothetical protein